MALDSWMYQNPERVLERKQEDAARKHRQCGNCVHHKTIEFKGETLHGCELRRHTYGKRCDQFSTKGDK